MPPAPPGRVVGAGGLAPRRAALAIQIGSRRHTVQFGKPDACRDLPRGVEGLREGGAELVVRGLGVLHEDQVLYGNHDGNGGQLPLVNGDALGRVGEVRRRSLEREARIPPGPGLRQDRVALPGLQGPDADCLRGRVRKPQRLLERHGPGLGTDRDGRREQGEQGHGGGGCVPHAVFPSRRDSTRR
jgi:hypothetical protein